ncbi:type II toxin-antitoxin system prevent-host-death family antitoxin [Gemmatimonas sp.]|uniref:type II toxin-antitoxin system Phd/YefM family antitoxin n=1 Tax=Gemmatimonas sp. TaxID=1962908 RepID=UPI00286DDDC7|nr:type II toxin-antitoxin system prevent-host-death family antitoxin [Gemmatimonas sp.]
MADEYSLYEAKAKLSALVKQVREGRTVIITVHGQPAAELRPIDPATRPQTLDERLAELTTRGVLLKPKRASLGDTSCPFGPRKTGALQRFLDDRE